MFDVAVEIGIAAFVAQPKAEDDDIAEALVNTGLAPWLARRLVAFLPLAVGRRLLTPALLSPEFVDGGVPRRFDDDPVYRAVAARALGANRDEVQAIGLRSAEVNAANQALNAGSKLENLRFTPPRVTASLPPIEPGDGGVPSPLEVFRGFIEGHGHSIRPPVAINARVIPRLDPRLAVQVDFAIAHPDLAVPWLGESFGGWGATWRDALSQAIVKFERGSVHALIAALFDRTSCPDQVDWERLHHPGGDFDLCLGAQLTLYAREPAANLGPLLDAVKEQLQKVPLSRRVHALRLFFVSDRGEPVCHEALLDNETWPAGVELLTRHAWPQVEALWGSRLFLLAIPA